MAFVEIDEKLINIDKIEMVLRHNDVAEHSVIVTNTDKFRVRMRIEKVIQAINDAIDKELGITQ